MTRPPAQRVGYPTILATGLVLVATLLAGCGASSTAGRTSASSPAEPLPPPRPDRGPPTFAWPDRAALEVRSSYVDVDTAGARSTSAGHYLGTPGLEAAPSPAATPLAAIAWWGGIGALAATPLPEADPSTPAARTAVRSAIS